MTDTFHFLGEPLLEFGHGQTAEDPHDGLALFGPAESRSQMPENIVIGTPQGIGLWREWCAALNAPAACVDPGRHRAWPPFPGFNVAFGAKWPNPIRSYAVDADSLSGASRKADKHDRAFTVANLYMQQLERLSKLDNRPALAVCVVPDEVFENCRPNSSVARANQSDVARSRGEVNFLKQAIVDRNNGQSRMFDDEDPVVTAKLEDIAEFEEARGLSPDFRRQLKARMMAHELPVQIVKESTLQVTPQVRNGEPGTNPLSDRLWNFSTAVYYKCGAKPWKTPWAREGVCYVGLAYKLTEDGRNACCAAQMFLDSGDGVVFVGEFGPWYSKDRGEFHLPPDKAEALLRGIIETYRQEDGRPLKEIFLHARSGIDTEEYQGFLRACPPSVNLVAIRVRQDRGGLRLYRYDEHPDVAKRGQHPVQRGVFWQRSGRYGLLFTNGFKPRIATYDGFEVPVPLAITVQHGNGDLVQIAKDILGLTKLNYNACQLGEGQPITVKYSDRVGEILLANPGLPSDKWKHNFKYYA
ncbi:hypothetical protein SAMN04515618_1203 [Collimonas sp. OK307]|uniref:hypothetical protein n=1 Tax=Collimonas sp. OK307 TaxID=1801620 RepID=UPI0008EFD575|nr:hypothetical protein [Collimonas sp. OK307]SFI37328.1 hypothetical protein SAMN04515618_1203 [Collimonas sp. OK307]